MRYISTVLLIATATLFLSCNKRVSEPISPNANKLVIQDDRVFGLPKDNGWRYRPPKPPGNGGAVMNLTATNGSNFTIHLSWQKYERKAYQYRVYRSQVSGFTPDQSTYLGFSHNTYLDDGAWPFAQLQPATTYYYRVTHVDRQGNESAPSAEASATTPPASTSRAVILLDFDGHIETSQAWTNNNGGNPINCAPSNLHPNQQSMLVDSFKHRYARWDVDIVTSETDYQAANPRKRTRVVFTATHAWWGLSGGVAFVGSFTSADNPSAFVFDSLLYYNQKYVQEAGFHEAGHTLGLYHHVDVGTVNGSCVITASYTIGCCGEAPIMGVGYYQPVTLFKVGRRSCTEWQDDVAIISQVLNLR